MTFHTDAMFSKKSDLWGTPQWLLHKIQRDLKMTFSSFDPCPYPKPKNFDGLQIDWGEKGTNVFVNPPFTRTREFLVKCREQASRGLNVAALVACRCETKWWHESVMKANEIYFIKGRISFTNLANKTEKQKAACFPSCIAVFRQNTPENGPLIKQFLKKD